MVQSPADSTESTPDVGLTAQTPGVLLPYATEKPELAVANTVNVPFGRYTCWLASAKMMNCAAGALITMVAVTVGAAAVLASPLCDAAIAQLPAAKMVTSAPEMVHTCGVVLA